jgi:hypothetical protein
MPWVSDALAGIMGRNQAVKPPTFDWVRYWCPRDGVIDVSDAGFLVEPGASLFQSPQDTEPFGEITRRKCLVLLGEPGIGKSTASGREYEAATAAIPNERKRRIDLRSYSQVELRDKLFNSSFFANWIEGDEDLHLWFDSLDECLDRVEHIAHLLRNEIERLPHERLVVRIVCRTADWSQELEASLQQWYGDDDFGVYELAPLTRRNASDAARDSGADESAFMAQVDALELGPLASKPLTLNMLINIFLSDGRLPESQLDLYERGCLVLCQEPDQQRRWRRARENASVDRLAASLRIAAATILGNRRAVWTGLDDGSVPDHDVLSSEIVGGSETLKGRDVEIDEPAITSALSTGLFTARGRSELGWAHLSYGEFLAALRLSDPDISLSTVKALVAHPLDSQALIPQLREVIGWLSGMREDVRAWILEMEPRVLLRSDAASIGMHDRAALVDALLAAAAQNPAALFGFATRPLLRKLVHPGIVSQLRSVLLDGSRSLEERTLACDIVEVGVVTDLHDVLLQLALDERQPRELRADATRAIATTGTSSSKLELKPLVSNGIGDPTNDVVGWALRGLWPEGISAEEVFSALVPYGEHNQFGAYWGFLTQDLVTSLRDDDVIAALQWAGSDALEAPSIDPIQQTITQVFSRAWTRVADDGLVAEAFARAALIRLERHYELCQARDSDLEELVAENKAARQAVTTHFVKIIASGDTDIAEAAGRVAHASPHLLRAYDLPWLEERLVTASDKERHVILQLIYRAFEPNVDGCLAVAFRLTDDPEARALFHGWLGPIELGSHEAREMQESFERQQTWRKERETPPAERPLQETAEGLLKRFEGGEWDAWWVLVTQIKATPPDAQTRLGETDLTQTPGWTLLDEATRARIVDAARRYLETGESRPSEWLGKGIYYRPAEAGYMGLRLLLDLDTSALETLTPITWRNWAPIVVACHNENTEEGRKKQQILIQGADRFAPDEVSLTLVTLIKHEDSEHGSVHVLDRMPQPSRHETEDRLIELVTNHDVGPAGISSILSHLATSASLRVLDVGRDLIEARKQDLDSATAAAQALFTNQPAQTFDWLMDIFESEPDFAKPVMGAVASVIHWDRQQVTQALSEHQLARLFAWLETHVDPPKEAAGVRPRGAADWLVDLSGSVLGDLRGRGTVEAVAVLESLCDRYTQHGGLPWILEEAREYMRRTTWIPPSAEEVTTLITDARKRLVQSEDDLVAVLIESLEKLQRLLQGETPQAPFLWNTIGDIRQPKIENDISDYIKSHLERDLLDRGVITGREVEIRRGQGGAPGERTDIHVTAVRLPHRSRQIADVVKAIIEVKGNWHGELLRAMQTQLVDRYLKNNECRAGIYLVTWFNCPQWDESDPRKAVAMRHDLPELKETLDSQARDLSNPSLLIRAHVLDAHLR